MWTCPRPRVAGNYASDHRKAMFLQTKHHAGFMAAPQQPILGCGMGHDNMPAQGASVVGSVLDCQKL